MNQFDVSPAVRYVGVDDRAIDLFEGQYAVPNGISYNSYVILDEKIAVMDTVDARAARAWLANVEAILGGRIEFRKEDNPVSSLIDGKIKFKIFLTPPPPAESLEADFELDPEYFNTLFSE